MNAASGIQRFDRPSGKSLPPAPTLLAALALCVLAAGCGQFGFAADEAGSTLEPRPVYEAGSTLDSPYRLPPREIAPREAGSSLAPRRGILGGSEAGSTLEPRRVERGLDPRPFEEAGSRLSPRRLTAPGEWEAGSTLSPRRTEGWEAGSTFSPRRAGDFEAGSRRIPEAGSARIQRRANHAGNGDAADPGFTYGPSNGQPSLSYELKQRLTPLALVLISLAGAALILFTLFKLGMGSPYAREQLTRRMDLCCDLADQLDSFMDAVRREDWDRCQAVLDQFHATNGRRSVLLSNQTNSALFRFLQVAINCRLSGRDPEYRRNLENKFALAVEALRKSSRQSELLSLENRQYLVDANRSYRKLRERA